jgi:hypothetical protein
VPDRLSRPPVRLLAAQPDGTLNGLGRAASHFLGPDHEVSRFLVLEVVRDELRHKDTSDADTAILRIKRAAMPGGQDELAAMLQEALDADFEGTVPAFALTDRGRYETALAGWVTEKGLTNEDLRERWVLHFGDQVPAPPVCSTEALIEFVLEVVGPVDDEEPAQ